MHIKEIVIDGFKSYANRTVIGGWDDLFNAITGLNGSGKSNILDAICFVLGISNLSQVRVKNLNELVYKKGQSRVTKASVTLVFDNSDTKTSPVGYEQYEELTITRQIVIGGRNKYLINGHTAQLGRVQNLFHSVGLNVNNPHFLIMQGRITKVCNMKPPEILSMIEEAAGTRMYENKKLGAQKTIVKKQVKVEEINKILVEEITPQLEKLRKERSSYLQWSSNNTELERLERFTVAYDFTEASYVVSESASRIDQLHEELKELEQNKEALTTRVSDLDIEMKALVAEKEHHFNSSFKSLEKRVNEVSKKLVKHTSVWQHSEDNMKDEQATKQSLENEVEKLNEAIDEKRQEIQSYEECVRESEELMQSLVDEVATLQSQQLGVHVCDDGKSAQGTLTNQLMDAQRRVTDCDAVLEGHEMKYKQLKATYKERKSMVKKCESDFKKLNKEREKHVKELKKLDAKLAKMGFSFEEKQTLETECASLNERVATLKNDESLLQAHMHGMHFDYHSPANFDRTKVKGMVATLMNVKDLRHATALEVTAGSKLYNVVVEDEHTGKTLLEKGKLKKRVTIIPLNKIQTSTIDGARVDAAENLVGSENVHTALSLVGYDDDVEAAMKYVFGRAFICADATKAKQVTFDERIRTMSVTLEGDVYDPSGSLTGGSAAAPGKILEKLCELNKIQSELYEVEEQLKSAQHQLAKMATVEESARELTMQKEMCCHQIALMDVRIKQCDFSQITNEVEEIQSTLDQVQFDISATQEEQATYSQKCEELQSSIEDFESQRNSQKQRIQEQLTTAKNKVKKLSDKHKEVVQRKDQLSMELQSFIEEKQQCEEAIGASAKRLHAIKQETLKLAEVVAACKTTYEEADGELAAEREQLLASEEGITKLRAERDEVKKQISAEALQKKEVKYKITNQNAETAKAAKVLEKMKRKYTWIEAEQALFGQAHTDYDFEAHDPLDARNRLAKLRSEQDRLAKKINKKVVGLMEKAEQDYQELMAKREQIEKDKMKIEQVMKELDRKKDETLQTTWKKVNRDLGSIFSTLLPGAMAKVEPPEGLTVLDGLELKVAFGKVWKQSLSELSGGQRSLLALSLILALLLFKPAPMYILDEVDAALDLSHTQNIGQMLKTHFPHSQFIVVSLKEGMFNNANVLFRTKFVEGVSTVNRTSNKQRKRQARAA